MADAPRTAETYLGLHTPPLDDELDEQWRWPYWKFGFRSNPLFTELHEEFNSMKCAIQDPQSWYHDVRDIAQAAGNREEFRELLRQRKQQRFGEADGAWETTKALLTAQPSRWENPPAADELWFTFVSLARNLSFDLLVKYFGSYLLDRDHDLPQLPPPPTPAEASPAKPEQRERTARARRATPRRTTRPAGISKTHHTRASEQPRRSTRLRRKHSGPNGAGQRMELMAMDQGRRESGRGR